MELILQMLEIAVGSGLIVAIYNNYSQIKLQNKLKLTEITENKFRSILIFMDIMLHPEQIIHTSEINNPMLKSININDSDSLIGFYSNLIKANKANIFLYADDKLIQAVDRFLNKPNEENYISVAKRMNRNLWR
ncbi:MAG: hypothetical protein N4A76_04095 [Firmicutes bacterium]|jgi:hypothetical protein|nr:hypothetical protein [Bacillota bacterium]